MRRPSVLILALLVGACAGGMASSVGTISDQDAQALAPSVVEFVKLRLQPSAGTITLDMPATDTTLGPSVAKALEAAGYKVADDGAHRLRYQAGTLDNGVLLRLSLDGGDAARYFQRVPFDGLHASGPFSIRAAS